MEPNDPEESRREKKEATERERANEKKNGDGVPRTYASDLDQSESTSANSGDSGGGGG